MVKHSVSKSKNPNQRVGRRKQVISLAANRNRNESTSGGRDGSGFNLSLSPATRVVMEGDTFQRSNKLDSLHQLQNQASNNNSQYIFKSEKTRQTNGTNSHNESTLYGSSGIGQLKENSFNLTSLQNSHIISHHQTSNKLPPSTHQLSIESGKRKKMKTIEVQGDKENGGRRSHGPGKPVGQKNPQNLFQNSVSVQDERNLSVQTLMMTQLEQAEDNAKTQGANLIVIDKQDQEVYHPYTTKNKIYNNADNKLALNNLQKAMGYHHEDVVDGQRVDLSAGALGNPTGNTRSHRVNLFESKTPK